MRKIDLTSFHVATSETARDINRRIVLDLIRTGQPISRADLARQSGLQPSTISAIADQLIGEQWITQGSLGHSLRGRKPRFLLLNNERAGVIGVNIRPQQTTLALTDLNAHFLTQDSMRTAADPKTFIAELSRRMRSLIESHSQRYYEGIGISLPGRVDQQTQRLAFAPNLGWRDVDIKTPLERATGLPVEVENAANACALSEMWFGKGNKGVHDLISLTVSEGIGTGIITNNQLVRGPNGVAGEFGHISINEDGDVCRCGNRGCWEVYASNTAAVNHYIQASAKTKKQSVAQVPAPSFDELLYLTEQGNPRAVAAIERMAHYLGVGIAMLVTAFAPTLIIVIGEVTRLWSRIEAIIKQVVTERSLSAATTRIVPSDESSQPRLRGTIALVLQKHFGAPLVA